MSVLLLLLMRIQSIIVVLVVLIVVSLLLLKVFCVFYWRFNPHFKTEEIEILELPYMTEQRLQNLGIPLGPRLRILEEIRNLR